jgi:FtsZ-binding cell division protein ZapB
MKLTEEVSRIKQLIFELSPKTAGVEEFLKFVKNKPELIRHLRFNSFEDLEYYILDSTYEDFVELQNEVDEFYKNKKESINNEIDEIQRASQDLSRNEGIEVSVDKLVKLFRNADEVILNDDVWKKLENTESNKIMKGEMKKVEDIAKKYNKTPPSKLKKSLLKNEYDRPLIIKFGDRYHLVAGNTRLSTAAALGFRPSVLIADTTDLLT